MGFDISSLLRNRNVFGPSGNTQQQTPYSNVSFMPQRPNIIPESPPVDTEGPSEKAYREFLANPAPERTDFHPGKMDRFGAALTGIAAGAQGGNGFNAARNQLDQPFQMAAGEYASKQDRLGKAAKFEGEQADTAFKNRLDTRRVGALETNAASNADNRASLIETRDERQNLAEIIAKGKPTPEQLQRWKILQIQEQNAGKINNTKEAGNQARQTENTRQAGRVALAEFKKNNPDHKYIMVKGGNVIAINPKTNEAEDTGIETGTMTDEEKATMPTITSSTASDSAGNSITTKKTTQKTASTKATTSAPSGTVLMKDSKGVDHYVRTADVPAFKKAYGLK